MDDMQESSVFKALIREILANPAFANTLVYGEPEKQKEVLYRFLDDMEYQGEKAQALEHLNQVLDNTDLEKMAALRDTLDGPVRVPF
jgi:hypothetical protein